MKGLIGQTGVVLPGVVLLQDRPTAVNSLELKYQNMYYVVFVCVWVWFYCLFGFFGGVKVGGFF